jgi:hypothetical protein
VNEEWREAWKWRVCTFAANVLELEPAAISGSLDEDLRKAAMRSAEVVGVKVAAVLPITTATLFRSD